MSQAATWGVPRSVAEADLSEEAWAVRADQSLDALLSSHSGSTAPSYAEAGTPWLDTSGSPYALKLYSGTAWGTIGFIDPSTGAWTRPSYDFLAGPIVNTGYPFPSGVDTLVPYEEASDTYGVYDPVARAFTAQESRMYLVTASGYLPGNATAYFSSLRLYLNGTFVWRHSPSHYSASERIMTLSTMGRLLAGDTIHVELFHNAGVTFSTTVTPTDGSRWNFAASIVA